MSTIFTRIIKGEIPCHKVYEDDLVFAFLDIGPLSEGHVVLVPKEEAATLDALSDESAAAVGRVLPRLCRAVMKATETSDYNILQNNGGLAHQEVEHVHFHIIPKPNPGHGLVIGWPKSTLDSEQGAELTKKIVAEL
jgi:histidine triad (HIT) family protein